MKTKINYLPYVNYLKRIPENGNHILAQQRGDQILVYQAFNPRIANYALEHQKFGGNAYSYERMSWIKPNFLWMMYRCGWASKEHQQLVLGIWILKSDFEQILKEAAYSSYQEHIYQTRENWKAALLEKEVRLQWDPDHDLHGEKQERRAIQLGLKGNILKSFGREMILEIVDMTPFVKEQKSLIDAGKVAEVRVPFEEVFKSSNLELNTFLRLD